MEIKKIEIDSNYFFVTWILMTVIFASTPIDLPIQPINMMFIPSPPIGSVSVGESISISDGVTVCVTRANNGITTCSS